MTREISGDQVTLNLGDNLDNAGRLLIAEELLSGSSATSSNIPTTYNNENILTWLLEGEVPNSITYTVSGSADNIQGKWALEDTGEEGVIQDA